MKRIYSLLVAAILSIGVGLAQELPQGYSPCSVQDLEGVWTKAEDGSNTVTLSFVTPTNMVDGNWETKEMDAEITKITIGRSISVQAEYRTVGTINNPQKGEAITFEDKNVPYGNYDYLVTVYVGKTSDFSYPIPVIVGEVPADFDDDAMTYSFDPENETRVILSVRLPELNSFGEPITMPYTKLEFGEMNPVLFTPVVMYTEEDEELLVPGQVVQYAVGYSGDGLHTYTAQVYTESGGNWPTTVNVFVGKDQPGRVQNIQVVPGEGGLMISWEAPARGMNGGNMGNIEDITYTVVRGGNENDANSVVVAKNIKEYSVFDKVEFTEETKFVYVITASSPYGEGYPKSSHELIMGPASKLPYTESFDVQNEYGNVSAEHPSWTRSTNSIYGYCAWNYGVNGTYMYDNTFINPHNGYGMMYAYYDNWMNHGTWDAITSGNIDFSDCAEPELSFWMYQIPVRKCGTELKVQVSNEEGFNDLLIMNVGDVEEAGWYKITLSLEALKGVAEGRIRFVATSLSNDPEALFCSVAIDEITIKDNAAESIEQITTTENNVIYDLNGQRVSKMQKGIFIVDGKKVIIK